MARLCPSLLLLVAVVALTSTGVHAWGSPKVVRKFQDIPKSYVYVQQALWFAMKEYNKASQDPYIFKVKEILKSQEQVSGSGSSFFVLFVLLLQPGHCPCRSAETRESS